VNLDNQKILLIAPKFFNYHKHIVKELELLGAIVKFVPEPQENVFFKLLRKTSKNLLSKTYEIIYSLRITKIVNYNYIFIIKGTGLTSKTITNLKRDNLTATFILYEWDSVKNYDFLNIINPFDKVISFDRDDCRTYGLTYLPLFYINSYKLLSEDIGKSFNYDILFIGTANFLRLQYFKNLTEKLKLYNITYYIKMHCSRWDYIKYFIKGSDLRFLTNKKISEKELLSLYQQSKSILDIPSGKQTGLTIRTFEALGSNKILITTNLNIVHEPFYNSSNVMLIGSGEINPKKLKETLSEIPQKIDSIYNYSITNWIRHIFA
jgi:hypothetical protein